MILLDGAATGGDGGYVTFISKFEFRNTFQRSYFKPRSLAGDSTSVDEIF